MLYNFEDTLIKRAECVSASNANSWKKAINSTERDEVVSETISYATYYLITKIGFLIFIIVIWITCGSIYIINRKKG